MQIIIPAVLAIIIAGGSYVYFSTATPDTNPETNDITRSPESERAEEQELTDETEPRGDTSTNTADTTSTDQYSATGEYQTPARTNHEIAVTLTLDEAGIVTDANVEYDGTPGYSNANQERFDAAYKNEVIGKPLEDISLSRVGGASLSTGAFNDAVATIADKRNS